MIENPPPGVDSHFTNIARIQIMTEILPRPATFADRRTFNQIDRRLQRTTSYLIMGTNRGRFASSPEELAQVRARYPGLVVLGTPTTAPTVGLHGAGVVEEQELQGEPDYDEMDEVDWADGWDDRVDDLVRRKQARSAEHTFYRGRDQFMERHYRSLMSERTYGHAIRHYMRQHGLEHTCIFRRVHKAS